MKDSRLKDVLTLFAFDDTDDLWWKVAKDGEIQMYVNCNDVFAWACADCEEIFEEDLEELQKAKDDLPGSVYWSLLWVSRKRGMRPQGAFIKGMEEKEREMFFAAGPDRSIDLFNPQSPEGVYLYKKESTP
jgi:hypothetical protein